MLKEHKVLQGSPEWLSLRKNLVTASNAHILLTKGFQSALDANDKEFAGNFWSKRGLILEKEAIELYEAINEVKVDIIGFLTNSKYPRCGYSPDGRKLEVKCFKEEKHLECLEEIPTKVYCQIQFGMMVADWDDIDVIFYNPDIEDSKLCFKVHNVKRDDKLINRFKEKLNG